MDEIICLISKPVAASENVIEEKFDENKEPVIRERPSRLIGPLFNIFEGIPSQINRESPHALSLRAVNRYTKYSKGYVKNDNMRNIALNEGFTLRYEMDPRVFWGNTKHTNILPKLLVEFALRVHSIRSSSACSEREFSRMGWMISQRRASITASNADMRLSLANLLPMKRKLENAMMKKNIKRINLFSI